MKRENYCFPYFYIRIFPRLCRITLIVIFARNFLGNLVQNFNFIFFIKFYILENNFVFYVSCINFRFLWKNVYSNSVIIYFTNLKHFVCLCWRYIFQVLPGMHVYIRNFSRVKTSSYLAIGEILVRQGVFWPICTETFSWSKSYLERSKILVKTFSALDGIVSLNCPVPNNKVKVTVTNKNFCKYKIYIWDKLKRKGCKKYVSDL